MSNLSVIPKSFKEKSYLTASKEEYCDYLIKKQKRAIIYILIGFLVLGLVGFFAIYKGQSAIVDLSIDLTSTNISPNQTIKVTTDTELEQGLYASISNASFSPIYAFIGIVSNYGSLIYGTEGHYAQYFNHKIVKNGDLAVNIIPILETAENQFLSSCVVPLSSAVSHIQIRLSADYYIFIEIYIRVSFTNPLFDDVILPFALINNHGLRNDTGYPIGSLLFPLENGKTTFIEITSLYYDYGIIPSYNSYWVEETDVTPYPFLLNATITTKFDWNTYINA